MRRRESFALWAAAIAVAGRLHAQGAQDSRRIAILSGFSKAGTAPVIDGLRRELSKLGWGDDQHIVLLEPRAVGGQYERLPALAAEIVTLNPSMVVVISVPATLAMKQATSTIPIIMMAVGDPVKYGLVASLARPGGNITGSGYFVNEVGPKLLQILHEAIPQLSQVAILGNSKNQGNAGYVQALETAGSSLGIKIHNVPLEGIEHLERALETI
jgi:putative tryptophan/tyrosine transport system substrate-binding protein